MRYLIPAALIFVAGLTGAAVAVNAFVMLPSDPYETYGDPGPPDIHKLQDVKERFTYEVRYSFLRLGNVHLYVKEDTVYRNTPALHVVAEIVSNDRIPLVGYRESHYHNFMAFNDSIPYGLRFQLNTLHLEKEEHYVMDFDYRKGKLYSFEEGELIDTLDLDEPADGGPSVVYYARLFAGTDHETRYPIYIEHEKSEISMNFSSRNEPFESPAFPGEEINTYLMEGNADFDGPFGFSGDFTARHKAGPLRIPLEARLNIWLGSVRLVLVEYERLN